MKSQTNSARERFGRWKILADRLDARPAGHEDSLALVTAGQWPSQSFPWDSVLGIAISQIDVDLTVFTHRKCTGATPLEVGRAQLNSSAIGSLFQIAFENNRFTELGKCRLRKAKTKFLSGQGARTRLSLPKTRLSPSQKNGYSISSCRPSKPSGWGTPSRVSQVGKRSKIPAFLIAPGLIPGPQAMRSPSRV